MGTVTANGDRGPRIARSSHTLDGKCHAPCALVTMTGAITPTLDTIHVTLEQLGYTGDAFGAARLVGMMYGIYRKLGATMTVSWQSGSAVYDVTATGGAAIDALSAELTRKGLICEPAGHRMRVHGQEHIDAEVMRMLQP